MKKLFRHKGIWLAGAVIALILCASVGTAMAYFTDNTYADGGLLINLSGRTEIHETVLDWKKSVTVTNEGDTDVYVRVKAFSGSQYTLDYSGAGWEPGEGGYYYYSAIVPAHGSTGELLIAIGGVPEGENAKDFNVTVVQECVPVTYEGEDGAARPADWNAAVPQSEEG